MNKAAIIPEYELLTTAWELVKAYHDYGPREPHPAAFCRTENLV